MKCPLKRSKYIWPSGTEECILEDCIKAECAWWDSIIQTCLIYALHTDLAYIGGLLSKMEEKIPHEGQFRK